MLNEKIIATIKEMEENEIIRIWNEYCSATNRYDDQIMDAYEMEEYINNSDDKMGLLNRFYFGSDDYNKEGSANPNRDYFCFNGYGNIISFDYIYNEYADEFYHMDIDELADYIEENKESFYSDELEELFEELEEE